jgi:hypothetical protein
MAASRSLRKSPMKRIIAVATTGFVCLVLAACTTTRLEDVAPTSAAQHTVEAMEFGGDEEAAAFAPPTPDAGSAGAAISSDPSSRGGYPNLNIRPDTAAPQISGAQKLERTRELREAQERAKSDEDESSTRTVTTAEEMRRLARQREEETLRRIEEQ